MLATVSAARPGEFNDSLSPIGNTAATLRAVIRTLAAEFASALSGLRSGIRLLAPEAQRDWG
ncbi:hypothetical protein FZ929_22455 [Klebsiella pneumoniae]|uniref:Uncharacterized protein n=1 Tax=Klebsiella pneumoniae TaxID=573 RepID=A0A5C2LK15_KLEPN|nr:hypothetical protein FZ929_22455 [Klebsiella pneumoniae]